MHDLAPLIYDLAIMLGLAAIVVVFFQRIQQPIVLGYLVAGMIVGPYTPPHAFLSDIPNIRILSELGVIFLMFSLGLEFSFKKLTQVGFSASVTGLIEVLLMVPIGYCAGLLLGWSFYDSLFLGAALAISSTTIIIKAIDELGLKTKRFATLIFGVLVVEDLLAILLLVALSTIVTTHNIFSFDMVFATLKLIIVVGGWFLIGYFLVPMLFRKIAKYLNQETLTIVSIALCLFLVCVAAQFHYSTALGAFIMGSILAETVLIKRIEELIQPIRDIFAAVFFISVGMLINPAVIAKEWRAVLIISLLTIIGKVLTTSTASLLTGQSLKNSMRVGFGMAQVGEFSFIIAALGVALGATSNKLYPIIVAVSAVTTFTTPYLIRFSGNISNNFAKYAPKRFHYFLDNYAAWVYRVRTSSERRSFFRSISVRLLINGILVAIIFTFIDRVIYYKILDYVNDINISNLISLCFALVAASPFIWGMLFSYRIKKLPAYAENAINPAIIIIWLITLAEISVLSIVYFETWLVVGGFLLLAIIFFLISYKQLEKSYRWFEKQLLSNINLEKENDKDVQYHNLAPWDSYLVEIDVDHHSKFVNKTLKENKVRESFGINIVAIYRGDEMIVSPRGEENIFPHDKLIVLGNDEQIDLFRQALEHVKTSTYQEDVLELFTMEALFIKSKDSMAGKSIRASKIRETVNGVVVGLERNNSRILNPDPETILKAHDVLFVVGEANKFRKLKML